MIKVGDIVYLKEESLGVSKSVIGEVIEKNSWFVRIKVINSPNENEIGLTLSIHLNKLI